MNVVDAHGVRGVPVASKVDIITEYPSRSGRFHPPLSARRSTTRIANFISQKPRMSNTHNLKSIGLKSTGPRLSILKLFEETEIRHLAAEDVYRTLMNDGMDIGLATVYRVLTQFEQAGILKRHHFEADKAVFELNEGTHHDHLVCMQCGRVEEFHDLEIEKRQQRIAKERGFSIQQHALALYADCVKTDCPNRKPLSPA